MSVNKNSLGYILTLMIGLCLVCSMLVSVAAIGLRDRQQGNIALERNANLLAAAGLLDMTVAGAKSQVGSLMQQVDTFLIDFTSGQLVEGMDATDYDQLNARDNPNASIALSRSEDIASIQRRENIGKIYIVRRQNNQPDAIILPIRGYGLWSTLYGFIALENDANTVRGLGFYQHQETPGLGGEVDNPRFKAMWPGKRVLNTQGEVAIGLAKNPDRNAPAYINQIDALSGATLTSRGVTNLVQFWLGDMGYGTFLNKVRNQEIAL